MGEVVMPTICRACGALCLALFACLAWRPLPARTAEGPAGEVGKWIEQLGDEDLATRKAAMTRLEALGEEALPALRKVIASDADVDVRLRAAVVASAIDGKQWGEVRAMGAGAGLKVSPPGGGYWINRVAFTRDGKYAVAGGGGLILFDLETGKEVRRVLEVGGARPGLAMARDGSHCLTGHANATDVHLVEVPSLKVVQTFKGHRLGVAGVALSADGARAASAGRDRALHVWDVKTGKVLWRLTGFRGLPSCVAFSPDGKRLLSGHSPLGGEPPLRLWGLDTGKEVRGLTGHTGQVTAVAFLPDGNTALSAGVDGTLRLWDLKAGKESRRLTHGGLVHDVAVSPDGKRALSAGFNDRTVRLWDLTTGRPVRAFDGHVNAVLGVAFSADGRRALSSDAVACVRLWKLGK
jgi:WD40 repeat protein